MAALLAAYSKIIVATGHEEYDFSKDRKNPYTNKLKKQITINIDADTIDYFKSQSKFSGIPYQTFINLYLSDCAERRDSCR